EDRVLVGLAGVLHGGRERDGAGLGDRAVAVHLPAQLAVEVVDPDEVDDDVTVVIDVRAGRQGAETEGDEAGGAEGRDGGARRAQGRGAVAHCSRPWARGVLRRPITISPGPTRRKASASGPAPAAPPRRGRL